MSESSKPGAGCGLALALALHAFIVELGVAGHGALAPVLWGLLLGALALDARAPGIALASAVFALMTPLRWFAPRWASPISLPWPAPVVTSPVPAIVDGLAFWANLLALVLLAIGASLGALLLTLGLARVGRVTRERPAWLDKGLEGVMWLALAAALAHTAVLAERSLTRASPAEYIAALPVILRAPPLVVSVERRRQTQSGQSVGYDDTAAARDLTIARSVLQENYIAFAIGRGAYGESRNWDSNPAFVVRYDSGSELMFFDDGNGPRAIRRSDPPLVVASHADLLPAVQPPRDWLVGALLGVGGALLLLLMRRRCSASWGRLAFVASVVATALSGLGPLN